MEERKASDRAYCTACGEFLDTVRDRHPRVHEHLSALPRSKGGRIIWTGYVKDLGFIIWKSWIEGTRKMEFFKHCASEVFVNKDGKDFNWNSLYTAAGLMHINPASSDFTQPSDYILALYS